MAEREVEERHDSPLQRRNAEGGPQLEQGPNRARAPAAGPDVVPTEVSGHGNRAVDAYVTAQLAPTGQQPGAPAVDPASNTAAPSGMVNPGVVAPGTATNGQVAQAGVGTGAVATGAAPAVTVATPGVPNQHAFEIIQREVLAKVPADSQAYAKGAVPEILKQAVALGITDPNQVAYMLATAEHESRFGKPKYSRSESLVEDHNPFKTNKKTGEVTATNHVSGAQLSAPDAAAMGTKYWDSAYGHKLGNSPGTTDGENFKGRGFVQLTGRSNYSAMSGRMNNQGFSYEQDGQTYGGKGNPAVDLTANPEHVNKNTTVAARALVDGMRAGSYGSRLDAHINDKKQDWTNARSSVNSDVGTNGPKIGGIAKGYAPAVSQWGTWDEVFRKPRSGFGGPR